MTTTHPLQSIRDRLEQGLIEIQQRVYRDWFDTLDRIGEEASKPVLPYKHPFLEPNQLDE